ncbi:MAG TPA: hypothetical protein VMD91_10290 [Candidatus Sulfotelmatobacter sp.]|nr:hypothetical protein [Candidatus Sulfotelmatobacter sp.]
MGNPIDRTFLIASKTGLVLRAVNRLRIDVTPLAGSVSIRTNWQIPLDMVWEMTSDDFNPNAADFGGTVRFRNLQFDGYLSTLGTDSGSLLLHPFAASGDGATVQLWNLTIARGPAPSSWNWTQYTPGGAILKAIVPQAYESFPGGAAIRPNFDYDRNLNILGDGPYVAGSAVEAWDGWSGGADNEVWMLLPYDPSAPPIDPPDGQPHI